MFENGSVSTDFESEKSLLGVLVAISIPIFTSQLEKSKLAADAANVRAKYAELIVAKIDGNNETASISLDTLKTAATKGSAVSVESGKIKVSRTGVDPVYIEIGAGVTVS